VKRCSGSNPVEPSPPSKALHGAKISKVFYLNSRDTYPSGIWWHPPRITGKEKYVGKWNDWTYEHSTAPWGFYALQAHLQIH